MASYGVGVSNVFAALDDEAPAAAPVHEPAGESASVKGKATPISVTTGSSAPHPSAAIRGGATRRRQGQSSGGKREFDRHSGTGRGHEIKRTGKGRYNWGSPAEEGATDEQAQQRRPRRPSGRRFKAGKSEEVSVGEKNETTEESGIAGAETIPETGALVDPAPEEEVDSDADKRDYEEYLKELEALRVEEDSRLEIRRVAEDEQDGMFQSTREFSRVLSTRVDDAGDVVDGSAASQKSKASKKKRSKKISAISLEEFNRKAASRRTGRGGRGGRGGFRPHSNDRRSSKSVDLDDKQAFPSLLSV